MLVEWWYYGQTEATALLRRTDSSSIEFVAETGREHHVVAYIRKLLALPFASGERFLLLRSVSFPASLYAKFSDIALAAKSATHFATIMQRWYHSPLGIEFAPRVTYLKAFL